MRLGTQALLMHFHKGLAFIFNRLVFTLNTKQVLRVVGTMGSSIYDVHKKIGILTHLPLSTCDHMSLIPSSRGRGRPHAIDMKYTSLSRNS